MSSWVRLVYLLVKLGHYDYSSDLTPGVIRSPCGIAIHRTVRAGSLEETCWSQNVLDPGFPEPPWMYWGWGVGSPWWGEGLCVWGTRTGHECEGLTPFRRCFTNIHTYKCFQFKETVAYKYKHGWMFLFSVFVWKMEIPTPKSDLLYQILGGWNLHYLHAPQ